MKIGEEIQNQAREITEKLKRQYRQHLGEELVEEKRALTERQKALDLREKDVGEREARLARYYLIPRAYIQVPLAIVCLAGITLAYLMLRPETGPGPRDGIQSAQPSAGSSEPGYATCVQRGIRYYKEIGSYPLLSSGEDAESQVRQMCSNSGFAFPE